MTGRRPTHRHRALLLVALPLVAMLAAAPTGAARAQDNAAATCPALQRILDAAPRRFRDLTDKDYSTLFESWRAKETLPGLDSCWIDDITAAFWCLHRAQGDTEAVRVADAQARRIAACWPSAPTARMSETGDDGITRIIQDWRPTPERRIRLVQRKPGAGVGLGAVFLYVY